MSEAPDPPRKIYGFKPTEFPQVNDLPGAPANAGSPGIPSAEPIDVRTLARDAHARLPAKAAPIATRENEIHGMLRDNLDRANAAGLNEVATRPRRSRRRRDYFYTLVIGNTLLLGGAWIMPIFGIAGMILFNVGVTWIMWFVMDDY